MTRTQAEARFTSVTQGKARSATAVVPVAASKYTAFEGWCGTCSRYWYTAAQRTTFFFYILAVFMGLAGSELAESDPVITCQIARLRTPRARVTEPGQDPHLRHGVHRAPYVPRSPEREKRPAAVRAGQTTQKSEFGR